MDTLSLSARALSAMRAVPLLAATTPRNGAAELARLAERFAAGQPCAPRFEHVRFDTTGAAAELEWLAAACRGLPEPARSLLAARVDELRLEAAMTACVGRPAFAELAARRYHEDARAARAADALARRWSLVAPGERELVPTDSADPRSLLSRVREAVGAHRAPFAVRVSPSLAAFAATGERTVYVAAGRRLGERAARRIAVHEVLGHVVPRVRAAREHPLFVLGTARGTDEQEGLALAYEERAGLLDAARCAELARRHVAIRAMRAGADFVEVTRALRGRGVALGESLAVAARVFRGSDGVFAGLGRESVYLASFWRVRARLARDPSAERWLASGQIAVAALDAIARLARPSDRRRRRHDGAQLAGRQASPEPLGTSATVWQT